MTSGQFAELLPIVAQVAGIDINKGKLLVDDLKRYISLQNYDSDFVKQFPNTSLYLYVVMPLVRILAEVAQIDH